MRVLLIDGHPDKDRLSAHLLDMFQRALPASDMIDRIAIRDLRFDPILRRGYTEPQPLEEDLQRATRAIMDADHIVIAHPLWWGAEPALMAGFYERVFMPGTTFRYHKRDPFWDKLLKGRSGDVLITTDTPVPWLKLRFGNPIGKRLRHQVLGFCGIRPLRVGFFGPVRRGGAEKRMAGWQRQIRALAESAGALRRGKKAS
ncbi:NAD(P)H-dependent oxidoreductase [Paracoccus sp. (in: a-proteobacteria)]|uniref:NAD(P)H-dependent oxidoreductase n=1 Tax=Paracoccus sp. TaxID=267 RepID=UPI003A862E1A